MTTGNGRRGISLRGLFTPERLVVLLSVAVILVVFWPRVTDSVYALRSQHAIDAAEKIFAAVERLEDESEEPVVSAGEELQFFAPDIPDFLALGPDPEGPVLGDFLEEGDLFTVTQINWYGAGDDDYVLVVDFRGAYGRYRRCEIRPEGPEWVGR